LERRGAIQDISSCIGRNASAVASEDDAGFNKTTELNGRFRNRDAESISNWSNWRGRGVCKLKARIVLPDSRHTHLAQYLPFAERPGHQRAHHTLRIDPALLSEFGKAIYKQARGVGHDDMDLKCDEAPVEPKSFRAR